jgi:hypothetical protein
MSSPLACAAARRLAILRSAAALAACSDRADPVAVPAPEEPRAELAQLRCTANVKDRAVSCVPPAGLSADARALVVGGQGQYVQLTSGQPVYDAADSTFAFTVNIQNLIPQPLGTADGTTADSLGVRIFFAQEPTLTAGAGAIAVANADGMETFTAGGQAFYQYAGTLLGADGILSRNETSEDRTWIFDVDPTVESFQFLLLVSAAVPFPEGYVDVTPAADTMAVGGTGQLAATVRSAVGNPIAGQPIAWTTSDSSVAVVADSGLVTAVGQGTAIITATSGSRTGSAAVTVCEAMDVGDVAVFDMPAGASLCLAGAGEYTLVPTNVSRIDHVSLDVTGTGIIPVAGLPSPDRLSSIRGGVRTASVPRPDYAFEARIRRMERGPIGTIGSGGIVGPRRAITPGVPSVGALMSINVETDNLCSTNDVRTGRVASVGTHVIILADTTNPSGGLTAGQYAALATQFDSLVFPAVTEAFGTPNDIDGNGGRVVVFFTRAVNELTPPGAETVNGGFFLWRDLVAAGSCPTSNRGELIYAMAADPAGTVNGNARTVAEVMQRTPRMMAHELQHLVNASRRFAQDASGPLEAPWLDEGLSHVAEELLFYRAAGLSPRGNLDTAVVNEGVLKGAFFQHAFSNFSALREWLRAPGDNGGFQVGGDVPASRGASWAFLRYAADRRGGDENAFWNALAGSLATGTDNLAAALGTDPLPWYRDFTAAMYADDAPGLAQTPAFTQPSWNFRALYSALDFDPAAGCDCVYPLAVRDPANGVTDTFSLADYGGAAYLRMGVSAGAFAGVTVRSAGAAPPATVRMTVIRRE